uniref:Uncharacterized protein n=3 Tax=Lotharella globosa TaxID=91324 RepID=A0A6V3KFZ2_9EUKA
MDSKEATANKDEMIAVIEDLTRELAMNTPSDPIGFMLETLQSCGNADKLKGTGEASRSVRLTSEAKTEKSFEENIKPLQRGPIWKSLFNDGKLQERFSRKQTVYENTCLRPTALYSYSGAYKKLFCITEDSRIFLEEDFPGPEYPRISMRLKGKAKITGIKEERSDPDGRQISWSITMQGSPVLNMMVSIAGMIMMMITWRLGSFHIWANGWIENVFTDIDEDAEALLNQALVNSKGGKALDLFIPKAKYKLFFRFYFPDGKGAGSLEDLVDNSALANAATLLEWESMCNLEFMRKKNFPVFQENEVETDVIRESLKINFSSPYMKPGILAFGYCPNCRAHGATRLQEKKFTHEFSHSELLEILEEYGADVSDSPCFTSWFTCVECKLPCHVRRISVCPFLGKFQRMGGNEETLQINMARDGNVTVKSFSGKKRYATSGETKGNCADEGPRREQKISIRLALPPRKSDPCRHGTWNGSGIKWSNGEIWKLISLAGDDDDDEDEDEDDFEE